jgi:predicted phosphodiesterase
MEKSLEVKIKQRDRWSCRLCGARFVDLELAGYKDDLENADSYITICGSCLKRIQAMPVNEVKELCEKAQKRTKVVFVGDLHGRFDKLDEALSSEEPFDYFISVGDVASLRDTINIGLTDKWGDRGYFVRGNHDNVQLFTPLEIVQELGVIKVAALNGMLKSRTFLKEQHNNISFHEIMYLSHLKDVDILVTHQPPTGVFNGMGEPVLEELLNYLVPKIYVFGHVHRYKLKFHLNTFVTSLPMIHKGHMSAYFQGRDLRNLEVVFKKGKKFIRV